MDKWFIAALFAISGLLEATEIGSFDIEPKQLQPEGKLSVLGYGTSQALDDALEQSLDLVLESGCRVIDTATLYQNEERIGETLSKWFKSGKLKREDVFITTKLPPFGNRPEGVRKYLDLSLESLQVDYVDLYLIQTPMGFHDLDDLEGDLDARLEPDPSTDLIAVWKSMEDQVVAGKIKAIGLSNFNITQIKRILNAATIKPTNLQIELHLYNQQVPLVEFCNHNNITVTAYSPLGAPYLETIVKNPDTGETLPKILDHPVVKDVAKKNNKTKAQILLRHSVQNGVAVIPKSTNSEHIKQNYDVFSFELDKADVEKLNGIDFGDAVRFWDFKFINGAAEHPEYPF